MCCYAKGRLRACDTPGTSTPRLLPTPPPRRLLRADLPVPTHYGWLPLGQPPTCSRRRKSSDDSRSPGRQVVKIRGPDFAVSDREPSLCLAIGGAGDVLHLVCATDRTHFTQRLERTSLVLAATTAQGRAGRYSGLATALLSGATRGAPWTGVEPPDHSASRPRSRGSGTLTSMIRPSGETLGAGPALTPVGRPSGRTRIVAHIVREWKEKRRARRAFGA